MKPNRILLFSIVTHNDSPTDVDSLTINRGLDNQLNSWIREGDVMSCFTRLLDYFFLPIRLLADLTKGQSVSFSFIMRFTVDFNMRVAI